MDDELIIELFFKRQELALVKCEEKYGKRLYKTANNILNNDSDAKECVNDTLLSTWKAIPPEKPRILGAFMSKISRNLAINKWKATRTQKRGGSRADLLLDELQDCIADTSKVDEIFEMDSVINQINLFLEQVEQDTRVMFTLRYFHGESIDQISRRFNVNSSNVKSKLFRLRKKLGEHLTKEGIAI